MTPRLARAALLLLALGATVAIGACGGGESESAEDAAAMKKAAPTRVQPDGSIRLTDQDRAALGLEVRPAAVADLPDSTLRFGRIVSPPSTEADVVAPITGRIARAPRVQLGQHVAAGTRLLDVEPSLDVAERVNARTLAAQRSGDIEASEREVQKAEADAQRARALAPQIVSAAQVQQAETTLATARARLEALRQAQAADAASRSTSIAVTAPIAGTIADLTATVGALVTRGDVLARILRPGDLWVDVSVPPDEPVGDRYEIVTGPGAIPARLLARGRITAAGGTRTDRLVVDARDASSLTPGATMSVRVGHGSTRGVVLPESAVVPGVETDTVFVEVSPNIFAVRPVVVAGRYGGQVRLASGLRAGERVVVRGGMALEGELVRSELSPAG